jgi:hypothetical protein
MNQSRDYSNMACLHREMERRSAQRTLKCVYIYVGVNKQLGNVEPAVVRCFVYTRSVLRSASLDVLFIALEIEPQHSQVLQS